MIGIEILILSLVTEIIALILFCKQPVKTRLINTGIVFAVLAIIFGSLGLILSII